MKIRCDVCDKDEASVFCTADEAALCGVCDHSVHHANKLASKHYRFSLLYPSSSKDSPVCDICQEKRAFLFCQQDRAILCRDCDVPIHTANEHTKKHNRFLLSGVKLSAASSLYKPSSLTGRHASSVTGPDSQPLIKKAASVTRMDSNQPSFAKPGDKTAAATNKAGGENNMLVNQGGNSSTSTISEYLIDMLPGWHVEDFLDTSPPPFGFCQKDDGVLALWDAELDSSGSNSNIGSFPSENLGIWVPQAPTPLYQNQYPSRVGFKEPAPNTKSSDNNNKNKRWSDDGGFTVPQISPQSIGFKRSRTLW